MKIFGIGIGKTGTKSLAAAIEVLGSSALHDGRQARIAFAQSVRNTEPLLAHLPERDAYFDGPFRILFPTLDVENPGSKFILTERDIESWIASQHGQRSRNLKNPFYKGDYKKPIDEQAMREAYPRHVDWVLRYFRGREEDLLRIRICEGDGWEKLCPFLGVPVPEVPFPSRNTASQENRRLQEQIEKQQNRGRIHAAMKWLRPGRRAA